MKRSRPRVLLAALALAVSATVVATAVVATAVVAVALPAEAATGDGSTADANIAFVGRWDTRTAGAYVPSWAGAYLRTGFTGTTVRLRQRNTIDLYYSIDGGTDVLLTNVSGTVNLTPTPLRAGNHTLRVSYRVVAGSYHGDAVFQGLTLDTGARTLPTTVPGRLIEFVGDSITVGQLSSKVALTAYGWLVGERLGAAHTQIAQGGACLVTNAAGCLGMNTQFLKLNSASTSPDWDFGRYQANVVVINLGANDTVSSVDFQAGYVTLLRNVRARYPAATILALRNFKGRFAAPTQAAVATLTAGGDAKVVFVNTDGWITSTTTDTVDGLHPNDLGHQKVADRLTPIVSSYLGSTAPSTTAPPTTTAPSTAPGGSAACQVGYVITSQWQGGFQGDVTVRNTGTVAVSGWTLRWSFPGDQQISQIWNASYTQSDAAVAATDASWNAVIAPGGTATFGFTGTFAATTNAKPTAFSLDASPCTLST